MDDIEMIPTASKVRGEGWWLPAMRTRVNGVAGELELLSYQKFFTPRQAKKMAAEIVKKKFTEREGETA